MFEGEEMTDERFLILSACIWLAPHVPKGISIINCCAMLLLAAAIGFGWMP
jgi:ABC-type multidrug transport system permease subunit